MILCRCEDVTAAEVKRAVAMGYLDLEEVKRYTGFGTGPCQGKECLRTVVEAIVAASPPGGARSLTPFTARPPLAPSELKWFAASPRAAVGAGAKAESASADPLPRTAARER